MAEFEDVKITSEGILFQNGLIMSESFARAENFRRWKRKRRNKKYEQSLKLRTFRKVDSAVWVTDDWSKGYFHWLADVLPKVVIAAGHLKDSRIFMPARFASSDLAKESLEMMGVSKFEFINENETIIADRLFLPVHTGESGNFHPEVITEVRRAVTAAFPEPAAADKRVYISRSRAKRRKVVNEDAVLNVVGEFGFEIVHAEDLTFAEQVRLFSSTRHLVSIHGAGLANMLFMPAGSRVMEFRKNDPRSSDCFANMASALGHEFQCVTAAATDEEQAPYSADLVVDTPELRDNLDRFLRN